MAAFLWAHELSLEGPKGGCKAKEISKEWIEANSSETLVYVPDANDLQAIREDFFGALDCLKKMKLRKAVRGRDVPAEIYRQIFLDPVEHSKTEGIDCPRAHSHIAFRFRERFIWLLAIIKFNHEPPVAMVPFWYLAAR